MKISVFVGTSLDGFLARKNHTFDFLPDNPEPHGYEEFIQSVDTIVIGRNTFEVVRRMGGWAYGKKRIVVLSSRKLDLSKIDGQVEQMSGEPAEITAKLEATGAKHLYVDGGITIQRFLHAGLITRMIITRVPVLIGEGIPLFGSLPHDVKVRHVSTKSFQSGLVTSEYEVVM
jgi:dihydrofolate reductase